MPWFPVDDSFYSHPKALATSLAARGLWATAGSWSSAHLTDGVVPVHVLASLGGTPELAAELVTAGLWRRTRNGYVFHDWLDWGSKRTAEQIRELRKTRAASGRKGGVASGKSRSNRRPKPKQVASPLVDGGLNPNTSTSTSPLPPAADAAGGSATACEHHARTLGHPAANCRACGTNPRGQPEPPPPSAAERHPSARSAGEASLAAGVTPNGRPADDKTIAAIAAQARQAINREG